MKIFDWILISLSGLMVLHALLQILSNPPEIFEMFPQARNIVLRKFYLAGIFLLIVAYRVWG